MQKTKQIDPGKSLKEKRAGQPNKKTNQVMAMMIRQLEQEGVKNYTIKVWK